jgi:hypothetical protein
MTMRFEAGAPDTQSLVEEAIGAAIRGDGDMLSKWVSVIEGINPDGERYLWILSDKDSSMPWDRLGMLDFALTQERERVRVTDED